MLPAVRRALASLALVPTAASAQLALEPILTPFTVAGCGIASCHEVRGVLRAFPTGVGGFAQHSVVVDYQRHSFRQAGGVLPRALTMGIVGSGGEVWNEIAAPCVVANDAGGTCIDDFPGRIVGAGPSALPIGVSITGGFVGVVLFPPGTEFPAGGGLPAYGGPDVVSDVVQLTAVAVPEPGTWALLGTGLLALGGVAVGRRRA